MKRIFTPFTLSDAGGLATVLQYKEEIQPGKKGDDYRGFKTEDYVFAPPKVEKVYQKTHLLEKLVADSDQLYINAHCDNGIDYLSTNVSCTSELKVTAEDLVNQLVGHGFPTTSLAKVKLWVCKGGQGKDSKESFAAGFSRKMWEAGYHTCKIFGYRRSVFQKFMKDGSDEYHKWAANDESAVSVERRIENAITGVSKDSQMAKMIWESELRTYQQDFQQAVDSILRSQFKHKLFPGLQSGGAMRGPRASDPTVRVQFRNGKEVGTT